jgi:hypothetical protein
MEMRIQFELLSFSVLHMMFSSLMPFEIEMDNAESFASKREND